jgi:hypothetical protein
MARRTSHLLVALPALLAFGCASEDPNEPTEPVEQEPNEQDEQDEPPDIAAPAEGGQTGSASCDDNPPDCVCDVIGGASILRGVITQSQTSQVQVEVVEVYGTAEAGIVPGVTIGGSFIVGQPCGIGDLAPPAVGLDVFVAFDPGPDRGQRLLQGWLQLMPYEDPLPITNQRSLASEDFGVLLADAACREHFSTEEPFLCDETF